MNFYKHYIGDYQRDTGHLSLAEHGAYRLMLDTYYATEKPLPVDRKTLYRLLRAETPTERKAIDSIVSQFWTVSKGGMINLRAITEIGKADKQAEINRQIALTREEKKRQRKAETGDRKNDEVYKAFSFDEGLYPAHPPVIESGYCGFDERGSVHDLNQVYKVYCDYSTGSDGKVQEKNSTIRDTAMRTNEGTDDQANAHASGVTKEGMPNPVVDTGMGDAIIITNAEPNHSHSHSQTLKRDDTIKKRAHVEEAIIYTPAELSKVMREVGVDAQSADPRIMALAAQGVSLLTMRAACEEAKRAKPHERIGSGYVVKIVERWAKEAASMKVRGARPVGASRGGGVFTERKRVLDGLTGRDRGVGQVVEMVEMVDGVIADMPVDAGCRMMEGESLPVPDLQATSTVPHTATGNMDAENG